MAYDQVKRNIEAKASLPPGKRSQNVPCAYRARGGNGDKACRTECMLRGRDTLVHGRTRHNPGEAPS